MNSSVEFFESDFFSALFPMDTCRYLITKGGPEIRNYVEKCLSAESEDRAFQFLAQTRVYASKPKNHLRRTVKLDPVAEFFLYEIIHKNRIKFRKPFTNNKKHFGYRIEKGAPITAVSSYTGFKQAQINYSSKYKYSLSFDVASYFNSIYHHDLVSWFANVGASEDDVNAFGAFLRQSNSGRSIDCWPQGIYPAKMVGNDFLRFIEQHHAIQSMAVVRFMDDITLFSDDEEVLTVDFHLIQKLLGQKGLSVNPSKTKEGNAGTTPNRDKIDAVKASLLSKRREVRISLYIDDYEAAFEAIKLSNKELDYIKNLLAQDSLSEEDADLILSIYRDYKEEVKPFLSSFSQSFPHLAKNIWSFCKQLDDDEFVGEFLTQVVENNALQEYQLFWFGWILQDCLMNTGYASNIIGKLYSHPNATIISKAKILEIPDNRYGLLEMRDGHLVAGRSDWLAWASAVGSRDLIPISRNHKLEYFANSSPMNYLIKSIVAAN